jgi:hypothetical protein
MMLPIWQKMCMISLGQEIESSLSSAMALEIVTYFIGSSVPAGRRGAMIFG